MSTPAASSSAGSSVFCSSVNLRRADGRLARDLPGDHRLLMPGLQEHAVLVDQQVVAGDVEDRPDVAARRQRGDGLRHAAGDGRQRPPELVLVGDQRHQTTAGGDP